MGSRSNLLFIKLWNWGHKHHSSSTFYKHQDKSKSLVRTVQRYCLFKKLEFLKFWLRFLAGKRWRHLAHFKARIQFPNQVPSILKKVLFPQPDLNPGPSNYKAAVLLTELHCQTENCGTIGGLYTQYAILAFIYSKYLRKSVLQLSQSCLCPSLVPNFSPKKD